MATSNVPDAQQDGGKKLDGQQPGSGKRDETVAVKLVGAELNDAIKKQVEYYFSRENLLQDQYLVGKMDKDHFVDLSVIADFKKIQALTTDEAEIIQALKTSVKITVDETNKKVRPTVINARTTLIIRNVSSAAPEDTVRSFLKDAKVPTIVSLRSDVGDNWFVSFESEDAAKTALDIVKLLKWDGKAVGCAIKSESLLKGLPPGSPPKVSMAGGVPVSGPQGYYIPVQYNAPPNPNYNYANFPQGDMQGGGYRQGGNMGVRGGGANRARGPGGVSPPTQNGGQLVGAGGMEDGASRRAQKKGKGKGREGGGGAGGEGSSPLGAAGPASQPPINMADFPELEGTLKREGSPAAAGRTPPKEQGAERDGDEGTVAPLKPSAASVVSSSVSKVAGKKPAEAAAPAGTAAVMNGHANGPTEESPKKPQTDANAEQKAAPTAAPNGTMQPPAAKKLSYAQMAQSKAKEEPPKPPQAAPPASPEKHK